MSALGRYRKLYVRLWRHPGFQALSGTDKLLALYLLTGPQTNRAGVYAWSPRAASADLGVSTKTVLRGQVHIRTVFDWAVSCPQSVLEIPSWLDWNPPENPNVVKAIYKDLQDIPPCPARDRALGRLTQFVKGYREPFANGFANQEQEQEPEQKEKKESVQPVENSTAEPPRTATMEGLGSIAQRWLPFTVDDLDAAKRRRQAIGRCPHTPTCPTTERCLHALAIEQRLRRAVR